MDYTSSERERFEELFRAHHGAVHAYVYRRADKGEVDDVVADVFLVAWRRRATVPDDPLPWLLGVARNTLGTKRRAESRRLRLIERAKSEAASERVASIDLDGESHLARLALTRLAANDREAITLIAWEGLTPGQAAVALGIPPNRFRVRLHRAVRRLRWAMEIASDETPDADRPARSVHPHSSQGALS
jgi:RNA polymerase sigma-70 factor, ECF subfamily